LAGGGQCGRAVLGFCLAGLALARHVLDHPALVRGRRVLDFAAGCGVAGIAAARAGAAHVEAADISAMALAAVTLNARANGVSVTALRQGHDGTEAEAAAQDIVGAACRWDIILAGDVCYEAPMTRHILPWLRGMARHADIWIADPGRAYLPAGGMAAFASYTVPTNLDLEDRATRVTTLYRLGA
jgi:predicted nicotinamide N-methyase